MGDRFTDLTQQQILMEIGRSLESIAISLQRLTAALVADEGNGPQIVPIPTMDVSA